MINTLAERELGNIPVSIATALAIDGLYNRHPDLKPMPKLPASKAKIIYLNARTLFRNIHGAIGDSDKAMAVNAKDYATSLLQEVDELKSALAQEEHPLEVVLYLPSYKSIAQYMGNGELKPLNTDKQKAYNTLENNTLQRIVDMYKDIENKPFLEVDMDIKVDTYQHIFILTHLPVDLLNVVNAADVYLVESHTGKVKSQDLWYTKFASERSPNIPFNKATLLFFGDSGGFFKPQNVKSRRRLIDIGTTRKWNAHTTPSRMLLGIELSSEPILLQTLRTLLR